MTVGNASGKGRNSAGIRLNSLTPGARCVPHSDGPIWA